MFQVTTVRSKPKSFSWSWSKIKNFETCSFRYYSIDVTKAVKEEESEILAWGNAVHDALHKYVSQGQPLPTSMAKFQGIADRVKNANGNVLVEQKLALTEDFGPCGFFDSAAWFRGIADALIINGPVALAIDYKLGKIVEDSQQLALLAACTFAHYPDVQRIRTEYWWLKEDAVSRAEFTRADIPAIWKNMLPRVEQLKRAHEANHFPPKPGNLCRRWCPVSGCEHHGK